MNYDKAIKLIESSFLAPLLKDENITDISYNGLSIYYQHNIEGRKRYEKQISFEQAFDFIRQISNLSEKFFSTSEPILDISIGKYRINAVHPSIARVGNVRSLTFSIRIASTKIIKLDDDKFMTVEVLRFLEKVIEHKQSLVIAGLTGTGKTELQKFLISKMPINTRVIVIDNVLELDQVRSNKFLDINSWQYDDRSTKFGINQLIRNALRSNPDWLIVAEARGAEMIEVLNSALTGIPIITTLHSEGIDTIRSRMVSMIKMNEKKMEDDDIKSDINSHIHFYVYVKKKFDDKNHIQRYISDILFINKEGKLFQVYDQKLGIHRIVLNKELINLLDYQIKEKDSAAINI